jgi:hypothetical protein
MPTFLTVYQASGGVVGVVLTPRGPLTNGLDQGTQQPPKTLVTIATAGLDHPTIRSNEIRRLIRRRPTQPRVAG